MVTGNNQEHDDRKRVQRAEHATPVHAAAPVASQLGHSDSDRLFTLSTSLLGYGGLSGRGNAPIKAAVMRQAQQTYGNRALQRFLRRNPVSLCSSLQRAAAPATSIQREEEEEERDDEQATSTSSGVTQQGSEGASVTVGPQGGTNAGAEGETSKGNAPEEDEQEVEETSPQEGQASGAGGSTEGETDEDEGQEDNGSDGTAPRQSADSSESEEGEEEADDGGGGDVEQIAPVSVNGDPTVVVAFGGTPSVNVQGKTTATFDGGKSHTEDQVTEAASGCKGCKDKDCVHVTGKLVMEFTVTTKVTLPKVPSFPKLTKCQKERVQEAINTTLADHEQQHVDAFETYNGTEEEQFDLTKCKAVMPAAIKALAKSRTKAVEAPRRASAKADSAALDPFNFDMDLDCEDD